MSNDDLIARLRGHLFGTEKVRTCDEAADALTAQANSLGFLRQISGQQAYEINQQAAEIERLRGIVPEVLEQLNDELCAENEALQQSLAECVEDSEELLANYLQAYGDRYRVDRLNHMREQIKRARALLPDPELEWLTGCPECGMDAGCDCDSGTENEPELAAPLCMCKPRAALSAPAGWQPIETAPKDGSQFLIWTNRIGFAVVAHDQDHPMPTDLVPSGHHLKVDDGKHGPYSIRGDYPTHWMPLPAAPSPQEQT